MAADSQDRQAATELIGHLKSILMGLRNEGSSSSEESDSTGNNSWIKLDPVRLFPTEIVFKVLRYLDEATLCLCRCVCKRWRRSVNENFRSLASLDFVPFESVLTVKGLKHILRYVHNLRELHLDNCWPSVTEDNLFLIAGNCSKLSVLTVSRCKGVTDAALEAVARRCSNLEELDLSSCFQVSDIGIAALSKGCANLRELHVSSCYGVSDKSITLLAKQSVNLEELDVSWCFYVTDGSIKEFLSPSCKLKLLRIKSCTQISQQVISQLIANGIIINNYF